ncbi:MAG: 50S ribosomal protein L18e [Candidatus Omnitrophica bacterium]|nr:50S ribosomal protein L18e [Candidatus Omnitrophota bacterium]
MAKRTGPTNQKTQELIISLKKQSRKEKVKLWRDIADRLQKPARKRAEVNLNKLEKYCKKNETALIPGKLLGDGSLTKPLTVSALNASESAIKKLQLTKSMYLSIEELMVKNPKGKKIRIMA